MSEIIFVVEESLDSGYEAKALSELIFTEGETMDELRSNIKEVVQCHFDIDPPKLIRLHYVKEEVFAA